MPTWAILWPIWGRLGAILGEFWAIRTKKQTRKKYKSKNKNGYKYRRKGGSFQCRGRGRGKPFPRGLRVATGRVESRHPTLNHPSPEGWWDSIKSIYIQLNKRK